MEMERQVQQALTRHFEEHQRYSGRKTLPLDARVSQIYDEVNQIELQAKLKQVSLLENEQDKISVENIAVNKVVSCVLIHFVECTAATEFSSETKHSIESIQELVGAVAAQRSSIARVILCDCLASLSVVVLERVRCAACHCIGWLVNYLFENDKMVKQEFESLLDMSSQLLLPRFTDKAQSVRQTAIVASRFFFRRASGQLGQDIDDPDIRQALQWSLQHDPSVTNRIAAIESLPVTLQTMDVILTRVRDVKQKVRFAAIKTLRASLPDVHKWEAEQCAELIEAGFTDRCAQIKKGVEGMVMDWLKSTNLDVLDLLRHLNVVDFEDTSQTVAQIILSALDDLLTECLTDSEVFKLKQRLSETLVETLPKNQALQVEKVFLLQARCQQANKLEPKQKELVLSEILPDIPEIIEMFELHASAVMKATAEEKEFETVNRLVCVCLHLLSMVKTADIEEGSRLHLRATMKGMLESVVTPDDLIEGCIETLERIHDVEQEFWAVAASTINSLVAQNDNDGLSQNRLVRILSIISIIFESSSSRLAASHIINEFAKHIKTSLAHDNLLVREAAVSCFGKLGLFAKEETLLSEFRPKLMQVALNESEVLAIRAQALLGLSDWSMLFPQVLSCCSTEDSSMSFQDLIGVILNHAELSLSCVAAEVACKLLMCDRVDETSWIAQLLIFFFHPRLNASDDIEEQQDSKAIGSPVRTQQLLMHFFPSYCIQSQSGRDSLIACILPALEIVTSMESGRKKRGTKALPLAKMLEFIINTTIEAETVLLRSVKRNGNEAGIKGSSSSLHIAIQLATFLSKKHHDLGVTMLRTICRILGKIGLDFERETTTDLKVLVDLMEDLGMKIDDEACLGYFCVLNDLLDDVDFSAQLEQRNGGDHDSLNQAMERVSIRPSGASADKENTDEAKSAQPQKGDEAAVHRTTRSKHLQSKLS